jgi:CheY-like chemotaxis protein
LPLILVASLGPDGIGKGGPFDGVLRKPVRSADLARLIDRVIDGFIERTPPPRQRVRLPSAPPPGGRLLVAEDNPINQEVMLELLRALGYRADLVDTGRKALEAIAKDDYALVLMDCQMPDLDGYAATQQIRERETGTGQHVPIIAVTAHALVGDRERALAAGMDDYLTKPIDRGALSRMLRRWLDEPEVTEPVRGLEIDPRVSRSQAVVRLFLEHAPKQIERIRVAAESADSAAVREAAHLLKGSCVAFGAPKMADVCRALESDPADRHALCRELEQSYAAIAASVQQQIAAR